MNPSTADAPGGDPYHHIVFVSSPTSISLLSLLYSKPLSLQLYLLASLLVVVVPRLVGRAVSLDGVAAVPSVASTGVMLDEY